MSPWPGDPNAKKGPPINPPSTRFPFTLNEKSSMADVADAMRTAYNGLTVHEQAFAALPSQITTAATAAASATVENITSENVSNVVTAFNAKAGPVIFFPGLGSVINAIGQSSYDTIQGTNGAVVLLADSTPVAVTLGAVAAPWFCLISNTGTGTATVTPADSGATINMDSTASLPGSSWAMVFADPVGDFWALGVSS